MIYDYGDLSTHVEAWEREKRASADRRADEIDARLRTDPRTAGVMERWDGFSKATVVLFIIGPLIGTWLPALICAGVGLVVATIDVRRLSPIWNDEPTPAQLKRLDEFEAAYTELGKGGE